ncbi:MAG: DUF370 domain-containing protein [Clostridia bacterium]|nr:DUF370 domain-containing protein [Clostridia bacterium]
MYLHLGNSFSVNGDNVIGIFDFENTTVSKRGRGFLPGAEKKGQIINASEDLPKSFVVTAENGETRVYISSISTQTLYKRTKFDNSEEFI